jgi:hypothetical protein
VADIAANAKNISTNATNITTVANRVKTLEDLGFILKDGYIYTEKTIVSKGEIISGRRASGTSTDVGGGGISSITAQMIADALGYIPYSASNPAGYITNSALKGYAKETDIPSLSGYATETWVKQQGYLTQHQDLSAYAKKTDIPSLNGYATQSWVEGKKYLTGITSAMVTSALGYTPYNSANFTKANIKATLGIADWALAASKPSYSWSEISGKPTFATVATSGKYSDLSGVPTSLPASDVYAWAKAATKPTYTASEVGALSTGGGTISKSSYVPLVIQNTASDLSTILFKGASGDLGYLGFNGASNPVYMAPSGYAYTLYHTGNFNPANYLPLSGGTITGNISIEGDATFSKTPYFLDSSIKILNPSKNQAAWFYYAGDSTWRVTSASWAAEYTLIHSDNIGSYNAGSATKLQTARTIWGQSFDGTADVSGILRLYDSNGYHANILGNTTGITLDTWRDDVGYLPIKLAPNGGNVLIGTTIDSGARLHINASVATSLQAVTTTTSLGIAQFLAPNAKTGVTGGMVLDFGVASSTYNSGNIAFRYHSSGNAANFISLGLYGNDNILNVFGSGNVAIGTTDSNPAYKLDVQGGDVRTSGNLLAYGEVISSRRASASDARLKDNITYLEAVDCLDLIKHIRPAEWDWKDGKGHSMGFIAQDVEQMMPYAVTRIDDCKLGQRLNLQYDQFTALAIGGIQAVDNKVEKLEKEVKELKKKLAKYETQWQ